MLLVLLSEAIRNSSSWTYHWNSIKEVGKINSASFNHCFSVTLGSSEVPKSKQHMSIETLLWNSAGKSFALLLLAVLAVSLAVCFPAADNIELHFILPCAAAGRIWGTLSLDAPIVSRSCSWVIAEIEWHFGIRVRAKRSWRPLDLMRQMRQF